MSCDHKHTDNLHIYFIYKEMDNLTENEVNNFFSFLPLQDHTQNQEKTFEFKIQLTRDESQQQQHKRRREKQFFKAAATTSSYVFEDHRFMSQTQCGSSQCCNHLVNCH